MKDGRIPIGRELRDALDDFLYDMKKRYGRNYQELLVDAIKSQVVIKAVCAEMERLLSEEVQDVLVQRQ